MIPASKRPFPQEMISAEKQVESWWKDQINRLPADAASATLLLCQAAAKRLANAFRDLDKTDPTVFHHTARQVVFALQTVLQAVKGALPPGEFPTIYAPPFLGVGQNVADDVLVKAVDYGYVRDVYLTFKWGGYNLECPSTNLLEFRDVPNWKGHRDDAVRQISARLEEEQALAAMHVLTGSGLPFLKSEYEGPQTLAVPQVNLTEFLQGWSAIKQEFLDDMLTGAPTIASLDQIAAMLKQRAGLNRATAEAFIRLISFDRTASAALTIFHCPLIPVTGASYVVMILPMVLSRVTTCVNRLAIHRGVGFDAVSKQIEAYYLDLIKRHFETSDLKVVPTVPYTFEGVARDIDLIAYDSAAKASARGDAQSLY